MVSIDDVSDDAAEEVVDTRSAQIKQGLISTSSVDFAIQVIVKCMAAMLFIWHALALFWGPMPDFYSKQTLDGWMRPYLRATNNDHSWAFFAPNPGRARVVSAHLILNDGQAREIAMWKWLPRQHPAYLRITTMLDEVRSESPDVSRALSLHVCALYRDARSVRLVVDIQYVLGADEYLQGKRPLDEEYLEREEMKEQLCPS